MFLPFATMRIIIYVFFFSFWLGPQKPSGGRPTNITLNIHNGVGLQQSNAAAAVVTGRVLWNLCARFNDLFLRTPWARRSGSSGQ